MFVAGLVAGLLLGLAFGVAFRRHRQRAGGGFVSAPARAAPPVGSAARDPTPAASFDVMDARLLPTFADVGGHDELKQELRDSVGLVLAHPEQAERYGVDWDGILLHGPSGCGKSFLARAIAGEFGLSLIPVDTADLLAGGDGARRVDALFRVAAKHRPSLVFLDELDSLAIRRDDRNNSSNAREVLTQLLQSVEACHDDPRVLVSAATNDLDAIDPAMLRPGRFDRQVRLDLPDATTRQQIFAACLARRPVMKSLDLVDLSTRTRGCTAAAIAHACEAAALAAFREAIGTGKVVRITQAHLLDALNTGRGQDRPTVESWNWSRLVLPEPTVAELQQIVALLEDPDTAAGLGVEPLSGLLLTGPPGTGKTTIAKVVAAEARCSFYPVSAADVTIQWVGESERAIARLFTRARNNAPSIVFIDEIDAIGAARGKLGAYDRQLAQLLAEIDGMSSVPGVFVLGATNRPQALDPALLRGGRLSRVIEIDLPDATGRLALLGLFTATMPLSGVDLEAFALETEGYSGADLRAVCQQAALESLVRRRADTAAPATVTQADIARALETRPAAPPAPTEPRRRRR